jgi:hypothetical protein
MRPKLISEPTWRAAVIYLMGHGDTYRGVSLTPKQQRCLDKYRCGPWTHGMPAPLAVRALQCAGWRTRV